MRKILSIAVREYGAMVGTKAFLISVTMMPLLMFSGIVVASRFSDSRDVSDSKIVVVDASGGVLYEHLLRAAIQRNSTIEVRDDGRPTQPRYELVRHEKDTINHAARFELSNQVRNGELKGFVEIPAGILGVPENTGAEGTGPENLGASPQVHFFAQNAVLADERRWMERAVNEAASAHRLGELGVDVDAVRRATAHVEVEPMPLAKETADDKAEGGDARAAASIFLPFGFLMLMFMVIMMSAQPMLESVLEEKAARIAEVILASASPFQIMAGKLLGNVAGSLSVVAIYAVGGFAAAWYKGWTDMIPVDLASWFLVYQVLAVLLFSSIFMAVGAAVSQLKEAQSLLLPVWLLICIPMFVWLPVVREPNGDIGTALSFFPPSIPLVMVLRLGSEAVIPLWQILSGLALLVATTLAVVYVAGRIFRVGILWQGKTPRVQEMLQWALRG